MCMVCVHSTYACMHTTAWKSGELVVDASFCLVISGRLGGERLCSLSQVPLFMFLF